MDRIELTQRISQLAQQRRDIRDDHARIAALRAAPARCEKELPELEGRHNFFSRKLARLTPEQEGEYTRLRERIDTLHQERSAMGFFQFGSRSRNSSELKSCQKRCKEIEEYRSFSSILTSVDQELEAMRKLNQTALSDARKLAEQVWEAESDCTSQTRVCLNAIGTLSKEDSRQLALKAPSAWADLPMNLLYVLCHDPKSPLRAALSPSQKVMLCAHNHHPFTMGKHRWQVVCANPHRALLLCMDPVCPKSAFHDRTGEVTWETSNARSVLNGSFLQGFTDEERSHILNYEETGSKVFLLSLEEAQRYLTQEQLAFDLGWWLRDALPLNKDLDTAPLVHCIDLAGQKQLERSISDAPFYMNLPTKYNFSLCYRPAMWVSVTPESDDTTWGNMWLHSRNGEVSFRGAWKSTISPWVRDCGYRSPSDANSGYLLPSSTYTSPDYISYDPLHHIDYGDI